MTRHPTTSELRHALAALCASKADVEKVLPRGHKRRVTHFDTRRTGGLEQRCVPIMGHAGGAIPGTRPGERL